MIQKPDINCDVGEISIELDKTLLPFVSSCNVCCGAHAGDPVLMTSTIREAAKLGVTVGAHPSYPDRANFGRLSLQMDHETLCRNLKIQICAVKAVAESLGVPLRHVKPHGALYHDVASGNELAVAFLKTVADVDPNLAVMGLADSAIAELCRERGQAFIHEAFGDRRYAGPNILVARSEPGAVIDSLEAFEQQIRQLLKGTITDQAGCSHQLTVDSICLHGDTKDARTFVERAMQMVSETNIAGSKSDGITPGGR